MGCNKLSIPKLQRLHHWSLGMDKSFRPTLYNGCNHLSMLGLKLNHVSKSGPSGSKSNNENYLSKVHVYQKKMATSPQTISSIAARVSVMALSWLTVKPVAYQYARNIDKPDSEMTEVATPGVKNVSIFTTIMVLCAVKIIITCHNEPDPGQYRPNTASILAILAWFRYVYYGGRTICELANETGDAFLALWAMIPCILLCCG